MDWWKMWMVAAYRRTGELSTKYLGWQPSGAESAFIDLLRSLSERCVCALNHVHICILVALSCMKANCDNNVVVIVVCQ